MKRIAALAFGLVVSAPDAAVAEPKVWTLDDGEKIAETAPPRETPPLRLFAMKNETIAFQVVVSADDAPLEGVTVDLERLVGPGGTIENTSTDPSQYVGRPIERFVEHFFDIPRASGGKHAGESLGWAKGSGPPPNAFVGSFPDALIPVEVAPPWRPYPMAIAPHRNGIVWIDVTFGRSAAPGLYRGAILVKARATTTIPIEVDVADITLPDRPVRTMLYYAKSELDRRIGEGHSEEQLFRLFHRHRIAPLHGATTPADVARLSPELDGSFYTRAHGYEGPGEALGDGVLSLGTYGTLGEPALAKVEPIADALAPFLSSTDAFVYAIDEDCRSPYGARWKTLLSGSPNANVRKLRVAWTCSEDATSQPVDIPIQAATFDAKKTAAARAKGKEVWAYNGLLPRTGSFLTDLPAVSPRVNGWLAAMLDIGRWFYWESTFWYDGNKGGHGPYDPFATAETFHNADGDWAMGDGVLVYPGRQVDAFQTHSAGFDGVFASIRLKNWRRGIEDAGYLQLARAAHPAEAEAIARALLPKTMSDAEDGKPPAWSDSGKPYFEARRALLALIPKGTDGGPGLGAKPGGPPAPPETGGGCGCRGCDRRSAGSAIGLGAVAFAFVRRRQRKEGVSRSAKTKAGRRP